MEVRVLRSPLVTHGRWIEGRSLRIAYTHQGLMGLTPRRPFGVSCLSMTRAGGGTSVGISKARCQPWASPVHAGAARLLAMRLASVTVPTGLCGAGLLDPIKSKAGSLVLGALLRFGWTPSMIPARRGRVLEWRFRVKRVPRSFAKRLNVAGLEIQCLMDRQRQNAAPFGGRLAFWEIGHGIKSTGFFPCWRTRKKPFPLTNRG